MAANVGHPVQALLPRRAARHEDVIGATAGEAAARVGRARAHHQRPWLLHGPWPDQGALDLEVPLGHVNLASGPELRNDLHELGGKS